MSIYASFPCLPAFETGKERGKSFSINREGLCSSCPLSHMLAGHVSGLPVRFIHSPRFGIPLLNRRALLSPVSVVSLLTAGLLESAAVQSTVNP
jgi:hypothetical protein